MSAETDTAGRSTVEPFKIPTVNIPDNAEASDYSLSFEIVTDAGMVVVSMPFETYKHVSCTGSAKALVASDLISPDWLIDGKKSWCVAFDEHSGPSLRIGGRGRPKGRYMSIDTYSDPGMFRLRWDTTRLEQDKYARCVDDLSRSGKLQQRNESTDKAAFGKPTTPWTPDQARAKYNYIIEGTIGALGDMSTVGFVFTPASLNRIHLAFEELRRAFADGSLVPVVPKYRTEGNVIHFPATTERRAAR